MNDYWLFQVKTSAVAVLIILSVIDLIYNVFR